MIGGAPDVYSATENIQLPEMSGRSTVPAQAYLDAAIAFRIKSGPLHPATIRLACQDILDPLPPGFVPKLNENDFTNLALGYSYFGDPRGRRFTLGIDIAL